MFRIPDFELHAGYVRLQSGTEVTGLSILVESSDAEEYLKFVTANYEANVIEGHMTRFGNLDRLTPIGYTPNFTVITPDGSIVPDTVDRPLRSATWQLSPRMCHNGSLLKHVRCLTYFFFSLSLLALSTYYTINWDAYTLLTDFVEMYGAIMALKNQTVISPVRPYQDAGVLTEAEHAAMHSSRSNSDVSYPHSFLHTPVHKIPNDANSKIVAYIGAGFAWDYALRNLLPNNVEGIIVEIKNNCNQSKFFELVGKDAFFLGNNATKESKFDNMAVVRDLSVNTHPNFTSTPGHCRYKIVRTLIAAIVCCCFNCI
jgi:hypothetical protein